MLSVILSRRDVLAENRGWTIIAVLVAFTATPYVEKCWRYLRQKRFLRNNPEVTPLPTYHADLWPTRWAKFVCNNVQSCIIFCLHGILYIAATILRSVHQKLIQWFANDTNSTQLVANLSDVTANTTRVAANLPAVSFPGGRNRAAEQTEPPVLSSRMEFKQEVASISMPPSVATADFTRVAANLPPASIFEQPKSAAGHADTLTPRSRMEFEQEAASMPPSVATVDSTRVAANPPPASIFEQRKSAAGQAGPVEQEAASIEPTIVTANSTQVAANLPPISILKRSILGELRRRGPERPRVTFQESSNGEVVPSCRYYIPSPPSNQKSVAQRSNDQKPIQQRATALPVPASYHFENQQQHQTSDDCLTSSDKENMSRRPFQSQKCNLAEQKQICAAMEPMTTNLRERRNEVDKRTPSAAQHNAQAPRANGFRFGSVEAPANVAGSSFQVDSTERSSRTETTAGGKRRRL